MPRISQDRWFIIIGVIMLGLILFFTIRLIFTPLSAKSPDHHSNGTSHITSIPARLTGTPHATREPTQSNNPAKTGVQLLQLSSDPYTNSTSQHKTEVEPGSYAYGSTIITAFQAGRFLNRSVWRGRHRLLRHDLLDGHRGGQPQEFLGGVTVER